ncbi:MAG: ParA family protein [Gammaproteobacteria bacterium]|nr:ParA family protein [Gammaproteobacteria bacterium]
MHTLRTSTPRPPAPARIVVLANQKGGPGKTTLAMCVAGELARRGHRVLVADADPQGTAARWAASAPASKPFPARVVATSGAADRLRDELRSQLPDYDFIVVDCPPSAESPVSRSALLVADLAIVPVVPSPPDLWAGLAIRQVIAGVVQVRPGLKARIVVNQRKARTRLASKTRELLPEYGIPVLNTQVGDREAFRHAAAGGLTVADVPRAQLAQAEVFGLTHEILNLLEEDPPP